MQIDTNLYAVEWPVRAELDATRIWEWQGHLGRLVQASDAKRAAALAPPVAVAPSAAHAPIAEAA
jgi:hypothetical protein